MATTIWVSTTGRSGAAGTENAPLASIQEAVNRATPGTTIMVKAGVYTENVIIRNAGTAGSPITLLSADGEGRAEIRPASSSDTIAVKAAHYITIDGFKVIGSGYGNAIHITSQEEMTRIPSHIVVQNNDIRPSSGDGVKVSQGDYITIQYNTVVGSTQEQGIDAVGVSHSVISHNDVSGVTGGAAIQVKGGSYDVTVSYNYVHDTGRWGILVGGSTNLQNIRPDAAGQNFEVKDITVIGNEVDGSSQQAVRVMGAVNANITGNWFHDVGSSRFIDVVASTETHPNWNNSNIKFQNNSVDRASWLTVESGQPQPTLVSNKTDGSAPTNWQAIDTGSAPSTSTPTPTPTPEPTPTPDPDTGTESPDSGAGTDTGTTTQKAAHDDTAITKVGTPVTIDVMANDDQANWVSASLTNPANGKLSSGGSNKVVYTPNAGFKGTDTFKYTLKDSSGNVSTATVTITVSDSGTTSDTGTTSPGTGTTSPGTGTTSPGTGTTPQLPAAHDDTATTSVGTPVKINVMANDDPFTWTKATISNPGHGKLSGAGGSAVVYTPEAGFKGTDTFKYTLMDDAGHQSTATVTVTVTDTGIVKTASLYDLYM